MNIKHVLLILCLVMGCEPQGAEPFETVVYKAGGGGYHTYRIPVVIATMEGTLLAFAEGRTGGQGDAGDIDLLVKRSEDGGETWSKAIVVWDDGANTCGNPAPVVDRETGTIHLLMTWNKGSDHESEIMTGTSEFPRLVFHTTSKDDGLTWAEPTDISASTREPDWRWYATGPVNGIQLEQGPYAGRLVIPANHSVPTEERDPAAYRSHVIYSDNGGGTWQLGGIQEPYTNESTIAELSDGRLMQNMRSYHGQNRRAVSTSADGGLTWSPVHLDSTLIEPVCQASLLRHGKVLLFSNPASTQRENMTIRVSHDDGESWTVEQVVYPESAAYSSLVSLPDRKVGLLYEREAYQEIIFGRVW